ncbi:hypothetical protein DFH29DRAFT_1080029 [Suillus ampliporus]|nr:hypothetical protein DFH29DRAFT_1080029 [Suillus ampliporus]
MTKKLLRLVGRSHPNPHLPVESGASENEPSSLPHGSRKGLFPKLRDKLANRSARSARQSPGLEPATASASAQDLLYTGTTQDASRSIAPTSEPNPDQFSSSGIANAEQPDPKFVSQRIADATRGVAGIKNDPAMVENTASAINNLQSLPDTIDTFAAMLGPLKAFNSIANGLADLHPYAKVALSIFTCASQMILDQASRDVAVSSLLAKISAVYALLTKEEALARISSVVEIYGKIA